MPSWVDPPAEGTDAQPKREQAAKGQREACHPQPLCPSGRVNEWETGALSLLHLLMKVRVLKHIQVLSYYL